MELLYHIQGLWPRLETMSGCGFAIKLYPAWKVAVAKSGLKQGNIDALLQHCGDQWLDGYGYGIKSENGIGGRLYTYRDIRIAWGEWGPEHMTIPGCNATGLDLDSFCQCGAPKAGAILTPHNVDNIRQAGLLLTIFLYIAEGFVMDSERQDRK